MGTPYKLTTHSFSNYTAIGLTGKQVSTQRRPSRAYLLRQKATGEETVVTLLPIQGNT